MSTNPTDPVNPILDSDPHGKPYTTYWGLNKREYFAAQFLQGMLAHPTRYKPHNPGTPWMECISREACNLADALIKTLNENPDEQKVLSDRSVQKDSIKLE